MDPQVSSHDINGLNNGEAPAPSQKRKRLPRALLACESCRSRKLRCDQLTPCTNCAKRSLACEYRSLEVPLPSAATHPNGSTAQPSTSSVAAGVPYEDPIKRRASSSASYSGNHDARSGYVPDVASYATFAPQPAFRQPPSVSRVTANSASQPAADADQGFEEVNRVTHGTEYYGPVSLFSFLKKLRSRATQRLTTNEKPEARSTRDARDMSIVNLLHSTDYPVTSPGSGHAGSPEARRGSASNHATPNSLRSPSSGQITQERTPSMSLPGNYPRMSNQDIERECVRLFFANLHHIHPILDQTAFLERCEAEIWSRGDTPREPVQNPFLALFNAIAAVGAIQAGEDAAFMRDSSSVRQAETYAGRNADGKAPTYPPIMLAKLFFERAKTHLGDVFEACSLETTQTLLFMAVFCQNALKPHSCYLYTGMAVRGALAIGLPNYCGPALIPASTTWWGLYSLEIEMCAVAGRESSLRDPSAYRIPLPHVAAPEDPKQMFHTKMVHLANIVAELSVETTDPEFSSRLGEKSTNCLSIDAKLLEWKRSLPSSLDWETSSLVEPEWVSKQKVVLRNRFLNTRLLIHRPFLIAASSPGETSPNPNYAFHVTACVAASVLTIEAVHDTYRHRPYFRTWWYNATYTLYASMVLLYVILSNIDVESNAAYEAGCGFNRDYLLKVVQMSVEIFQAMDMVAVARRCVEVTQEVLDIAKRPPPPAASEALTASGSINSSAFVTTGANNTWDGTSFPEFDQGLDFLIDNNLMDGLGSFSGLGAVDGRFDFMDFNSVLGGDGTF